MPQDYYETLGVKRDASDDAISKAYRDMARKHHPDLNPGDAKAKQKFQDVQLAFEVLGNKEKRAKYDRFGPGFESMGGGQGWPGGGPHPGGPGGAPFNVDLGDLFGNGRGGAGAGGAFADLFKQFSAGRGPAPGGPRGPGGSRAAPARGADMTHEITVPFATAISGGEAAITAPRAAAAPETITVKIPAGIEDGKKIRLRGQGEPGPGGAPSGDLLLTIRVAPHPCFTRRGTRLDITAPITLAEAAAGAKIDVPTPGGPVTLTVPPGVSSGKRLRLKGRGVAAEGKPPGDLFVELQIVLPDDLTDDEREQIAQITAGRPAAPRGDLRW